MKRTLTLSLAVLVLAAFASAGAITLDVKEHTLANGMKILMIPKPGVPRVVCHIYFKVGSINEKPGITGIWQVLGRDGIPFEEMVKLDYMYVSSWSLSWDVKLLMQTVPAVVQKRGAY